MKEINASVEILTPLNGEEVLKHIERCGRVCYKSEDKITEDSAEKFVRGIIRSGHEAVIEHFSVTVRFICDRGVSHEIVRHRVASFCQESTRYCNYSKGKYGSELTFIKPSFYNVLDTEEKAKQYLAWQWACQQSEIAYLELIKLGAKAEEARDVLLNSLKTELVMTANLREWRHFLKLRCDKAAHPQMREVALMLLTQLHESVPVVFDDIWEAYHGEV